MFLRLIYSDIEGKEIEIVCKVATSMEARVALPLIVSKFISSTLNTEAVSGSSLPHSFSLVFHTDDDFSLEVGFDLDLEPILECLQVLPAELRDPVALLVLEIADVVENFEEMLSTYDEVVALSALLKPQGDISWFFGLEPRERFSILASIKDPEGNYVLTREEINSLCDRMDDIGYKDSTLAET